MQLSKYKKLLIDELSTANEEIEHLANIEQQQEHVQSLESALDEDYEGGEESVVTDSQTDFWNIRKQRILNALEKIEGDKYGVCEKCGDKISEARLEALPFARHCISCQSALDNSVY